jgi:hypothetical protein
MQEGDMLMYATIKGEHSWRKARSVDVYAFKLRNVIQYYDYCKARNMQYKRKYLSHHQLFQNSEYFGFSPGYSSSEQVEQVSIVPVLLYLAASFCYF